MMSHSTIFFQKIIANEPFYVGDHTQHRRLSILVVLLHPRLRRDWH